MTAKPQNPGLCGSEFLFGKSGKYRDYPCISDEKMARGHFRGMNFRLPSPEMTPPGKAFGKKSPANPQNRENNSQKIQETQKRPFHGRFWAARIISEIEFRSRSGSYVIFAGIILRIRSRRMIYSLIIFIYTAAKENFSGQIPQQGDISAPIFGILFCGLIRLIGCHARNLLPRRIQGEHPFAGNACDFRWFPASIPVGGRSSIVRRSPHPEIIFSLQKKDNEKSEK